MKSDLNSSDSHFIVGWSVNTGKTSIYTQDGILVVDVPDDEDAMEIVRKMELDLETIIAIERQSRKFFRANPDCHLLDAKGRDITPHGEERDADLDVMREKVAEYVAEKAR